ncbi:hypothetical protein K4F52_007468 [Lecanicillium sp. MT-2017a]|nr:hypothetical protein K4F52_007468 [Lecanicillium sp. MT-2017a]
MSRAILVTNATGKQGRGVVDALVAANSSSASSPNYLILAATRGANSRGAQSLASKSSAVRLVEGNLDNVPALFAAAKTAASNDDATLWGVFSMQVAMGKGTTSEGEVRQGKAVIDESIKAGVEHLVYSSVDRGGDAKSWENPTDVPHFRSKHEIELYLRDATAGGQSSMKWTILRPVIFMDNMAPGFETKVLLTSLRDTVKDKPLQWVATKDIGVAAELAFSNQDAWHAKAVGLASDELTFDQLSKVFEKVTGKPAPTTFGFFGTLLKYGVAEMGVMINWFRDVGYGADIAKNRQFNPEGQTLEAWLKTSAFAKQE